MAKGKEFVRNLKNNQNSYFQYLDQLTELSLSMFEWKNIPKTIDVRIMELALFSQGQAVFFYDDVLEYLCLQCAIGGKLNVYRIPIKRRAYAGNGYNKELTDKDSVIIYNNMIHTNARLVCLNFAKRLYNLDRTIDINVNSQKTPLLITCDDNQLLSMKNVYMKYEGNEPVIFGDKQLTPNTIQVLQTGAPYVADKLYTLKTQVWNEALTYLGISNVNIQKKERLITDEVSRNQGGVIANRFSRLNSRKEACRKINDMFGLNIECEYRSDVELMLEKVDINNVDVGGDDNE